MPLFGSTSYFLRRMNSDMSDTSFTLAVSLEPALECLLFVAGEPLPISEMARALQVDEISIEGALRSLQIGLTERGSGLQLIRIAGGGNSPHAQRSMR